MMKILVACEFSNTVSQAFRNKGHEVVSCDLLESESKDLSHRHYRGDVCDILQDGWDLMIAFPPCTHLAGSGARWLRHKTLDTIEALDFVRVLMLAPIQRIAIENPVGLISTYLRPPDQIIHPWQFGHGEKKRTCLWLKNLPKLQPTNVVAGREERSFRQTVGPNRWKRRSRTLPGIAEAFANQWSIEK
jgi:hypothetical protein